MLNQEKYIRYAAEFAAANARLRMVRYPGIRVQISTGGKRLLEVVPCG